jgi:spore maturation protein CgeB
MRRIHGAEGPATAPREPVTALRIVIFGLSITSSWGNGHATTYRGLVRELVTRGNDVLFLERDVPWYAAARDLPEPPWGRTALYADLVELRDRHQCAVREADIVIVGSYVPEGVELGEWVLRTAGGAVAFYDIDTPITLAKLARNDSEYLSRALVRRYDLYLSFTGGPTLRRIARRYGSPMVRPLYCSVDPWMYFPQPQEPRWDLGYMGTYSPDRQLPLGRLLSDAAREWSGGRFVVAGPLYPPDLAWPANVERVEHLPATEHRDFYNAQRFALNITRADMVAAGYSPSVRLFEAAACGVPIISDWWEGIDTILEPGTEILIARSAADTLRYVRGMPEPERRAIGQRARSRVLAEHTSAHRAAQLEGYAASLLDRERVASRMPAS